MDEERFSALLQFFKALADESRLKIIGILANQECSVEELASMLGLQAPTVSHHLGKLRSVGLLDMRREGTTHFYRLDVESLQRMSAQFLSHERVALPWHASADAWERKVLESFTDQGNLKNIPASHKKKLVILRWLAAQFEPGRRYKEVEVNEILKQYHPDFATLRRELIDNVLMVRQSGVYWRADENK